MTKHAQELRDQSQEELEVTYHDLRKTMFEIVNTKQQEKKLQKPHLLRKTKKDIARVLTILQEKQYAQKSES